jgi:RNA polymerase sigma-70 factor (ECF subfamily)
LTIVANAARSRRTSTGRHPTFDLSLAARTASAARSPEQEALSAEDAQELLQAMAQLRADDRQVLMCRYVFELSEAETAAVLGCPRGTVKSRLSRALPRLRQQLVADGGGNDG